ncbi:MAG: DUF1573 domain-containing protein [Saprospiraceae bacterium]|nr:DUF1573 domain-containing protein [Saprospiraceae bacterium]
MNTLQRNQIILFLLLLIVGCKNNSESGKTESSPLVQSTAVHGNSMGKAKMNIPVLEKNFGDVLRGDTLRHSFMISNPGTDTLTVTELTPLCPCISADMKNFKLAPNDTGWINLTYVTASKIAYDEKELIVSGNGFPPKLTIRVSANIHARNEQLR